MLRKLSLHNFKSWEHAELKLPRITGLFGTNSSGKSSLIQFLLLLKQTKEATDGAISLDLTAQYINLGSFRDAIFKHNEELNLSWNLEFDRSSPILITDPSLPRNRPVTRSGVIELAGRVHASSRGACGALLKLSSRSKSEIHSRTEGVQTTVHFH